MASDNELPLDLPEAQQPAQRNASMKMGHVPALPLPILMEDGSFTVISIPKMTAAAFDFFKAQLEAYRDAIVADPSDPKQSGE